MAGINHGAQRPKTARHLKQAAQTKVFTNRTKEEREKYQAQTDAWAEKEREKDVEREAAREARWAEKRAAARKARDAEDPFTY